LLSKERDVKSKLVIVGLGPGKADSITRGAWRIMEGSEVLFVRTRFHPAVSELPEGLEIRSFDHFYEEFDGFDQVYGAITEELMTSLERGTDVVYAVPGDPFVGEASVAALLERTAASDDIEVEIIAGISFIEPCLQAIGADALDGLMIADAIELAAAHHPPFPPDRPALIGQVHSRLVASGVKLTLMNQYPEDHEVILIQAAGTEQERVSPMPLFSMDRSSDFGLQTSLYVPALPRTSAFEGFQETVAHLRAPDGCPWDREQTHRSLRPHVLEEAYETLEALDREDMGALKEELGDLLLQIVLQAQIATEEGEFSMADVIAHIQEKIIRRHPHVFDDLELDDVDKVLHNWETLKETERLNDAQGKGLLDGVPAGMPALAQASEIQSRVVRVGFDWPDIEGVLGKLFEELGEVRDAVSGQERSDEIGDLLFAIVNYARWMKVDPESALRESNQRFRMRFHKMEQAAEQGGRRLSEMTLEEMDQLWEASKGVRE
jgi:tetrapyrrole methylase family protein/MazG family protein